MTDGVTSREVHALRSLHDLITTVHSVQDLEEVLQTVAAGVVDVLGFQVAVISCLDSQGDLVVLAAAGDEDACVAMRGSRAPLQEFVDEFELADAWGSLRFLPHDRLPEDASSGWVPDVRPLDVPDAWHPLDTLYALLHGPTGELLGVLNVDLPVTGRRPGALSRQILEMYAVQAGLAIHHAQERDRLRERVRLSNATRTVVETTGRESDLERALRRSCRPLARGFSCDWLALEVFPLRDPGASGVDGAGAAVPAPGQRVLHPPDLLDRLGPYRPAEPTGTHDEIGVRLRRLAARVARACWPVSRTCVFAEVADTTKGLIDEAERSALTGPLAALGSTNVMLAPLGAGRECLGYLVMGRADPSSVWSEAESRAALEVGREMGRAVEAARVHQRERELITELQELDRYKGEMIATITHELKTPLTAIIGHGELLHETVAGLPHVGAINRNARRLVDLVDDMLLLTTVKDPNRPFEPRPVDLGALVLEACEMVGLQATQREVTLDVARVRGEVLVPGDSYEVARLIANIVGNAVKYTPPGGTVALEVEHLGDRVVFACADSGIGIAEADLATLFDEFDRSSNPVAHALPGSGLGLAIVRRIADRHGGRVAVESELGLGSTFRVTLPPLVLHDEQTPPSEKAVVSPYASGMSGR
jgi:signal transduction histidine kinase